MSQTAVTTRTTIAVVLVSALLAGAMVLLLATSGPGSDAQAAESCGGGGGGGGDGTPAPSGSATGSASPSPSDSDGGFPTDILTNLPGGDESSQPPSGGPSSSPTDGGGTMTQRCASKLTIDYDRGAFHGAVRSESARCKTGRTVKVFEERGRRDRNVGTTVSKRRGKWRERFAAGGERYYAKVAKATVPSPDGKIVCGAATSKTIKAGK